MKFMRQGFPLWQIVGTLLFDIRLSICAMRAIEFLHNRIFHPNFLDHFIKSGEVVAPARTISSVLLYNRRLIMASTHHSFGGITLTMPDFIPYLSILSTSLGKLRNCSID
jgi:hypothetical protein